MIMSFSCIVYSSFESDIRTWTCVVDLLRMAGKEFGASHLSTPGRARASFMGRRNAHGTDRGLPVIKIINTLQNHVVIVDICRK